MSDASSDRMFTQGFKKGSPPSRLLPGRLLFGGALI